MRKFVFAVLILALAGVVAEPALGKKRTIKSVKSEQSATQKRINETSRKINENARQTEKKLNELNLIRGEITQKESEISMTRSQVDSLSVAIAGTQDSIALLDAKLKGLKDTYVKALRKLQGTRSFSDELAYIFSSESFAKARARIRYVSEFSKWRKRKALEIRRASEALKQQEDNLSQLQSKRTASLNSLSSDQAMLKVKQEQTDKLVAQLKSDGAGLQKALEKEKKRLKTIDSEITRMIEAERKERERQEQSRRRQQEKKAGQKKSATSKDRGNKSTSSTKAGKGDKPTNDSAPVSKPKVQIDNSDPDAKLTSKFEAAKGSMMFPVASPYRIVAGFGSSAGHPNNTGIEIVLDGSANARCVYEGTVSRIFRNHDGNYSVMVRHGAYITVFYNIGSLSVKANEKVRAGQTIGSVAVDGRYGKPMLHFEVRKGSLTLNPQSWVK